MKNETILINGVEYPSNYKFTEEEKLASIPQIEGLEKVTETYKDGKINRIYHCKNGKKEGLYKSYYKNGRFRDEGSFKDDKLEGICKVYYDNGRLKSEFNCKDGKFHGLCKKCYSDGNLEWERTYENGVMVSEAPRMQNETININGIEYQANHKFTEEEKLLSMPEMEGFERRIGLTGLNETGLIHGIVFRKIEKYARNKIKIKERTWYESGVISTEWSIFTDGTIFRKFDEKGQLVEKICYNKNGVCEIAA